jgi:hypothetical protein
MSQEDVEIAINAINPAESQLDKTDYQAWKRHLGAKMRRMKGEDKNLSIERCRYQLFEKRTF